MTHEGLQPNPAPKEVANAELPITSEQLRKFMIYARNLDADQDKEVYFAMTDKYKRHVERKFWRFKAQLDISERRGSEGYREKMAQLEEQYGEQVNLFPYFSASEPEPLDTSGNETAIYYRLPEDSSGPEMLDP
jgi:hypothetical protein